jgi:hypothetical protein
MINYNKFSGEACDKQGKCYGSMPSCPDFIIKQHDNRPKFCVDITDCDAPVDLNDLVVEASMWCNAKLKININSDTNTISFADNIGFEQINYDTIIQIGNGRLFERMLVKQINDMDNTVTVLRRQLDTGSYSWKKGTSIKLIRFLNNSAVGEMEYQDVEQLDGNVVKDQLVRSTLCYEWKDIDTCMCGKYFFEFKILKVDVTAASNYFSGSNFTSVISGSNLLPNYHCDNGSLIEWVRRYPNDREGFLIQVLGSPTAE